VTVQSLVIALLRGADQQPCNFITPDLRTLEVARRPTPRVLDCG
jgi:hypothetical protein